MSEKKPESEPKKKSILDELRNFQIASLAIQHQAGIHGRIGDIKYFKIHWSGPSLGLRDLGSNFYDPMTGSVNP